ncbi:MAG: NlpC/P60 family protein [Bryobacteraceae bacterium]
MHALAAIAMLAATAPQAVVTKPVANMYARPTRDADVVSQAIYGNTVTTLEQSAGWLHVRTADQYTGWMPLSEVRLSGPGEQPYASGGRVARVDSLFAHIYREANVTRHEPLLTVPFETRLEVVAEPDDNPRWLQVRLPDDRAGWLQHGDVSFDPNPLSIPAVIELSRRFLGLPYTWGGTSSFGYDCSGFTQMLCRRRGVLIPRDADQQCAWQGVAVVQRAALQPGDLLYFGSTPDHITHTGLYIGGNQFINATTWTHPVIQICDLRDPHWNGLLVACRRLK